MQNIFIKIFIHCQKAMNGMNPVLSRMIRKQDISRKRIWIRRENPERR